MDTTRLCHAGADFESRRSKNLDAGRMHARGSDFGEFGPGGQKTVTITCRTGLIDDANRLADPCRGNVTER